MDYENHLILVEKYPNKVAKLTLNIPPLNLMTRASRKELFNSIKQLNRDPDVRCIVICGNQRAFSVGSNLNESLENSQDPVGKKMQLEAETFNMLECNDKFTIAAIEGLALGGGIELAIACDMRVMAKDAKAGFPEINIGLRPGTGCFRLPKLVGTGKALELMVLGEPLDAEECLRIGLVNRVVEAERVLEVALEIAGTVARKSTQSVKVIRASVREYGFSPSEECFWVNLRHCAQIYESDDWREGLDAFFEKRPPNFFDRMQ